MRYIKLETGWVSVSSTNAPMFEGPSNPKPFEQPVEINPMFEGPSEPRPEPDFYKDFGKDQDLPGFWESLGNDTAQWALEEMAIFFKGIGRFLLEIAPDASITLAMAFCLGAIASIPKMGKLTAVMVTVGVMSEAIRQTLPPY